MSGPTLDKTLSKMRVAGALVAVIAHAFLASGSNLIGVIISLAGQFLFLPWSVRNQLWDMVALDTFYVAINAGALLWGIG